MEQILIDFFGEQTENVPLYGEVSRYVEDMISPSVITNYQGNGPSAFYEGLTTNDLIDICAPAYQVPLYGRTLVSGVPSYGDATSPSTPYVTGTVGLMLSLNDCLLPDEVEDILQLTSKNLEHIQGNEPFIGRSGSGKLETGDAVEFVSEAMNSSGDALIDGQDFYRFNFDLQHINNTLTISNQTFRDSNTSNFVAKNTIEVLANSDFKPNANGFIDLKIDSELVLCPAPQDKVSEVKDKNKALKKAASITKLFPNPNKGAFTVMLSRKDLKTVSINIMDVMGKTVYSTVSNQQTFDINIPNLPSGLYFVKLSSNDYNETLKFVKN